MEATFQIVLSFCFLLSFDWADAKEMTEKLQNLVCLRHVEFCKNNISGNGLRDDGEREGRLEDASTREIRTVPFASRFHV
ncbi:hypothetical protein MUK42_37232 [Musa troglodytarum]|uniref:Secreted protein n=1 Tax=Musa troglodytarum TaxID=320322 RepID=A0A9E7KQQ2_9LILI|nr:hypothetical protein MUK42_37232 [Musa troglodytarum]